MKENREFHFDILIAVKQLMTTFIYKIFTGYMLIDIKNAHERSHATLEHFPKFSSYL